MRKNLHTTINTPKGDSHVSWLPVCVCSAYPLHFAECNSPAATHLPRTTLRMRNFVSSVQRQETVGRMGSGMRDAGLRMQDAGPRTK